MSHINAFNLDIKTFYQKKINCLPSNEILDSMNFKTSMTKTIRLVSVFRSLPHSLTSHNLEIKCFFENTMGKGENAGNGHFLLFPNGFPTIQEKIPFE